MVSKESTRITEYFDRVLNEKDNTDDWEHKDSSDVSCSVLLTPDSTPTKDGHTIPSCSDDDLENTHQKNTRTNLLNFKKLNVISDSQQNQECNQIEKKTLTRSNSDSILDSPKPTKPKIVRSQLKANSSTEVKSVGRPPKAGRSAKGKRGQKKQTDAVTKSPSNTSVQNRSKSVPPKKKPEITNHLVTEYFAVRRSSRVPSSKLKKKQESDLEKDILSHCEDGLKVVEFPGKGRGVVACKPFFRGDFVVEYAGDLIEISNAKQREQDYSSNSMIGCYMYYFNHQNQKYCIDATKETGKLGRLLNHSRQSFNCATRVVSIGSKPYLIIVAARDIKVGEELLYDYGDRSKSSLEAHPWLAL